MDSNYIVTDPLPGFRVVRYETDRFKTGCLSVGLVLPLQEDAAKYAILPYLLTKTCAAYPTTTALNKKLAELYGTYLTPSVGKYGENQVLRLSLSFLDNRFAFDKEDLLLESAELLCQVLFAPNLTEDGLFPVSEVEREKRLLQERLEAESNDKRAYALRRCEEIMCAEEAYHINVWGTTESVAALTPEDVTAAWREALQTARIQVNVVGNGAIDKVVSTFEKALSAVDRSGPLTALCSGIHPEGTALKEVTEKQEIQQGKLVLGFRTGMQDPEADFAAYTAMADLFGGGVYSRLFKNVREAQSLCYYCSARLYSRKGILIVQSGIEPENAEKAKASILEQLADLQAGHVTEEDMNNSHRSLEDRYHSVSDSPDDIEGWAHVRICDPQFKTPQEIADALQAVTAEQVIAAAKTVKLDTVFLLKGAGNGPEAQPEEEAEA
jgi:predicted Zn-dependent peptidase